MAYTPEDDEIAGAVAGDLLKLRKVANLSEGYQAFKKWRARNNLELIQEIQGRLKDTRSETLNHFNAILDQIANEIQNVEEGNNE